MPRFSVIIATYNASALLPQTLKSLAAQTWRDFNLIVQDGASSDDTIATLRNWQDKLPDVLLASEKDGGIYDAWNKALDKWYDKLGEWVLFLGAGDELATADTLEQVANTLTKGTPETLYAGGSVQHVGKHGENGTVSPYTVEALWQQRAMVPHSALFHRKSVFQTQRFDTSFRICGDRDFLCRTWTEANGNLVLPFVVTKMLAGGTCDCPQLYFAGRLEIARILKRYYGIGWFHWPEVLVLAKSFMVRLLCAVFGTKTGPVLDYFRRLRGLEPRWTA